jgi:ABC-2 type transport system permease protein
MMNLNHVWTVTTKDMAILIRKKYVLYATIILPLVLSVGLPLLIMFILNKNNTPIQALLPVITAFSFFYVILASVIPQTLATYSFVGEKIEKSLEPLLATPTTDGELLFGKFLAAFFPSICMLFIGGGIFMIIMNAVISGKLGYNYYPNVTFDLILFLLVPLAAIFSVELCIIISSRATDIRSAQVLSGLVIIPMIVVYVLLEINVISLENSTLLYIAVGIGLIDVILFFVSKSLFQREEILTRWK